MATFPRGAEPGQWPMKTEASLMERRPADEPGARVTEHEKTSSGAALNESGELRGYPEPCFSPRMGAVARSQGREPLDRIT